VKFAILFEALKDLGRRKLLWLGQTALLAAALALSFAFLTLPVARWWQLALHAACFLALGGLCFLSYWWARRALPARPWAVKEPVFGLALILWLLVALWAPWRLLWWVPAVEGLPLQALSAALRFLLAGLLFTGASLWLAACKEVPHEEPTLPPAEPASH